MSGGGDPRSALTLLDWRQRVFAMYADVRIQADPAVAHARWQGARDALFHTHPQSPLSAERKERFTGLPVAPDNPAFRFVCAVEDSPPEHRDVETGTDSVVSCGRIGHVRLGDMGTPDIWSSRGYG